MLATVTMLVVALAATACGGTEKPAPTADAASTTTVTTQTDPAADAAIAVCRQVISSAGVMIRDYNAFIKRLNATHDYGEIGNEDRYARETFATGAELIRKSLTPQVPDDIEAKVQSFLTATDQLAEQISKRNKLALNRGMTDWSERRTELLDSCGEFMPVGTS